VLLLWVAISAVLVGLIAALLTKGTVVLTSRLGGERVSRIVADAEFIVEHHAVPPAWQGELARKLSGLQPECADSLKKAGHEARAKRACRRRLERLIAFARKTSVVADEEARGILVSELAAAAGEWEFASWGRMCFPDGGSGPGFSPSPRRLKRPS
jgi:hypothetical protein